MADTTPILSYFNDFWLKASFFISTTPLVERNQQFLPLTLLDLFCIPSFQCFFI